MTRPFRWLLAAALMVALTSANAAAIELAGVKIEDQLNLEGNALQLNGAGVRYKTVIRVYTAGLYLSRKAQSMEEALAAPGAKRMAITMLRDIDANELGKLFMRGVEDNSPKSEFSRLIPGLLRMGQLFADKKNLKAGDSFTIDWVPGKGTLIAINGQQQGAPIAEQAFFNALMRIWLGQVPADFKLKDALLGLPAT
ncbi:chalcone isomerase family protein [Variovorax dokdonensis]|uniref:Chalcone isomerase family protein n=1 Tax=Variovorax dokdonensis TaxID=344883 RepID=A0ABT7NAN4_9BURK|nr:chalcone isomerase family protein [Variovorax dokdonensis]MDM0044988.1 chalcone isomerase family protein [Variovorax dokdonensis]